MKNETQNPAAEPDNKVKKKSKKKIIILLCVICAAAIAAGLYVLTACGENKQFENFKVLAEYDNRFTDVTPEDWFEPDVTTACSYGLISGVSDTEFAPNDNITAAACITMASRLHHMYYTGEELDLVLETDPWYADYEAYALENNIISEPFEDYDAYLTRAQFAGVFAHALPDNALNRINSVEDNSIPDVPKDCDYRDEIYKLYRAGVITGSDSASRAFPDDNILRSEAASVLLRMADPSMRKNITLTEKIDIYTTDGDKDTIDALDFGSYEEKGWYNYPVTTVYAADGRSYIIPEDEKDDWLAVDWYDYPVMTVYAEDGRTSVIPVEEKEDWLSVGWYDSPVITVYAADGRTRLIPENEKEDWLAVGWYGSRFIQMPDVLRAKNATSTEIPVLSIGTGGTAVTSGETYVPCTVNTFNVEEDLSLFNAQGGIRLRGNASRSANPYRIKFDTKYNLLGLNDGAKAKSWVLLNYPDGAVECIKNDIAFRIGRMLMEPDDVYCSDARLVHVYLNEGFCGAYLLCEQTQVNKHRVNVNEPENGYTGTDVGYLVELDNYSEPPYFRMNYEDATVADMTDKSRKLSSAAYSIKSDTFSREQEDFIAKYVRGVFRIMYEACEKKNYLTFDNNYNVVASDFTNAQETMEAVVDMKSFVDMYILYEIMHDNDVGEGSFFMCVDFSEKSKHPKLTFIAPWDFNWSCMNEPTGTFYAATYCTDSFMKTFGDRSNPWFIILYKQWWFRELVSKKWTEIGGSQGVAKCTAEENAILNKYQPDINWKKASSVSSSKFYLNWIDTRSKWLDESWLKQSEN